MSAILPQYNIAYISAPKCACTSAKETIFCLENNCRFNKIRDHKGALCLVINGKRHYIHDFYPSIAFAKQPQQLMQTLHRFCIVRDPIDRIVSCYKNRVLRYKVLGPDAISAAEIEAPAQPNLNQFIHHLPQYQKIADIKHHTLPLTHFLGNQSNYYQEIFNLRTLNQLEQTLQRHFNNRKAKLPHLQRSDESRPSSHHYELTQQSETLIKTWYEEDYQTYEQFF